MGYHRLALFPAFDDAKITTWIFSTWKSRDVKGVVTVEAKKNSPQNIAHY